MSVKLAYSQGFEAGINAVAVKLGSYYGIDPNALAADLRSSVQAKIALDKGEMGGIGGGALLGGAGAGYAGNKYLGDAGKYMTDLVKGSGEIGATREMLAKAMGHSPAALAGLAGAGLGALGGYGLSHLAGAGQPEPVPELSAMDKAKLMMGMGGGQ